MALIGCSQRWLRLAGIGARVCPSRLAASAAAVPAVAAASGDAAASATSDPLAWRPTVGVTVEQSLEVADYFQVDRLVSKRQLMEHRVHLGHKAGCRSEWMTPHLFGCRCGVDIIDLEQTAPMLRLALNFTAHVAARGGIVLFFWQGWPALAPLVERRVRDMGEFAYTRPYVDQALTDSGNYFDTATRLPDLAVFLSCMSPVMLPHPAIASCAKVMIPTVGICDSNADPRLVTYPVPGNDDSPQSLRLYLALFGEAIRRGKAAFANLSAATVGATATATAAPAAPPAAHEAFRRAQLQALHHRAEERGSEQTPSSERTPSPLRADSAPSGDNDSRERRPPRRSSRLAGSAEVLQRQSRFRPPSLHQPPPLPPRES